MNTQTLSLKWNNIPFTLSFKLNHMNIEGLVHLEIHCDEPLPVTTTGYRSIFIHDSEITDIKLAAALVRNELDTQAQQLGWQRDRQLALF